MQRTLHGDTYRHLLEMLLEARLGAEVTQDELARRLEVHQTVISKCERGVRRLDVLELREWVQALGLSFPTFAAALDDRLQRNRPPHLP